MEIDILGIPVIRSLQDITEEVLRHANSPYGITNSFSWGTNSHGLKPYSVQVWYNVISLLKDGFEFRILVEGPHLWAIFNKSKNQQIIVPEYTIGTWCDDLTPENYSCTNVFEALKNGTISGEYVNQLFQKQCFKDRDAMYFMGKSGIYFLQIPRTPGEKYKCHKYRVGLFYSATHCEKVPYHKKS